VYTVEKGANPQEIMSWVVVDGQASEQYDHVSMPIFNHDGKRLAYAAKKDKKWLVVVDSQAGAEYDGLLEEPGNLSFSPDGQHLSYIVEQGDKSFLVVDGQISVEYGHIGDSPIFSPDRKHVAYAAFDFKTWKSWLVVNGQSGAEYDALIAQPVFSLDSKHVACWVRNRKSGKEFVALDGKPGSEYDDIYYAFPLIFNPDGVLEFLAFKNHSLYRVKYIPAP
jgi:Tol biopolymer transport system component